jgi:hypothetical protein
MRRYLRQGLETDLYRLLIHINLPLLVENETAAVQRAISRLENYATWPATFVHSMFLSSHQPAATTFSNFIQINTSTHEATNQMHAATLAWFEEDRPAVEIYIPWEDQPRRTLSIRARDVDVHVIRQAAEAMQADWQARGIPYNFHVEIDYYRWNDLAGVDARSARFLTELMAGMGHDMFIFDPIVHNIHTLSNSGLLQNIYTLIDADPNTSLDEFFTQALKAFEINNGLYVFPTSFGMNYVRINAGIPQQFQDRFAQNPSITLVEMMELYLDLLDSYENEFGHLLFDDGAGITGIAHFNNALQTVMGEFIDFNAGIANLTDPRFIETLELMGVVYAKSNTQHRRQTVPALGYGGWTWVRDSICANWNICMCDSWCPCDWPCQGWFWGFIDRLHMEYLAQNYLFFAISMNLTQFEGFFTTTQPRGFVHHIPLADSRGRLLIDTPGNFRQVWSGICITSGADGELAWEFARHLNYAYANPTQGPTYVVVASRGDWGAQSLASPILRSVFRENTMQNFHYAHDKLGIPNTYCPFDRFALPAFEGFQSRSSRTQQFEAAIDRIAVYNEQPMTMLWPMIPPRLVQDPLDQFLRGLITAEIAAQRMQNSVSLWLIE